MRGVWIAIAGLMAAPSLAAEANPLIDYAGFQKITAETAPKRAPRLIPFDAFKAMAARGDVLLLDARSERAFASGHIEGAVNLPLTDFTADSLASVIGPDVNRPILIYCNNNFTNNVAPVVLKSRPVALNIQTFINLAAYGYGNVWELGEAVDFNNPKVGWVKG